MLVRNSLQIGTCQLLSQPHLESESLQPEPLHLDSGIWGGGGGGGEERRRKIDYKHKKTSDGDIHSEYCALFIIIIFCCLNDESLAIAASYSLYFCQKASGSYSYGYVAMLSRCNACISSIKTTFAFKKQAAGERITNSYSIVSRHICLHNMYPLIHQVMSLYFPFIVTYASI